MTISDMLCVYASKLLPAKQLSASGRAPAPTLWGRARHSGRSRGCLISAVFLALTKKGSPGLCTGAALQLPSDTQRRSCDRWRRDPAGRKRQRLLRPVALTVTAARYRRSKSTILRYRTSRWLETFYSEAMLATPSSSTSAICILFAPGALRMAGNSSW